MSKIILYYANWCMHCHEFLPEWAKIKNYIDNNKLNIKCEQYEESNIPNEMQDKIEGFPTIIIEKNGNSQKYTGKRTMSNILSELNVNLEQKEDFTNTEKSNITITLFHWKDCFPCKKFIGTEENPGEWQKFKKLIDDDIKNGKYTVIYREYERSSIPKKYEDDITSFPTIIIEQGDKKFKYLESRDHDKIYDYIQSLTSQSGGFMNMLYKYKYKKYKALYKSIRNI